MGNYSLLQSQDCRLFFNILSKHDKTLFKTHMWIQNSTDIEERKERRSFFLLSLEKRERNKIKWKKEKKSKKINKEKNKKMKKKKKNNKKQRKMRIKLHKPFQKWHQTNHLIKMQTKNSYTYILISIFNYQLNRILPYTFSSHKVCG